MTVEQMKIETKRLISEASTEKLKELEHAFILEYAKRNGVSQFNPDKNYTALIGIEEQLTLIRAELRSRR